MSKSHVGTLSKIWRAILADARQAYPGLQADFDKDQIRLDILVKAQGIRVYLEYLPSIAKHFDRCLSEGAYSRAGLPLTKRSSAREQTPKFLRGLFLRVFNQNGALLEDPDIEAIFFIRQLTLFAKKYVLPCPEAAVKNAVFEMVVCDSQLPEPSRFWTDSSVDLASAGFRGFTTYPLAAGIELESRHTFLANLDIVSRLVSSTLGYYNPLEWRCKHGPGAISEITGPSDKFCWTGWSDTLDRVFSYDRYGFHNYSSWAGTMVHPNSPLDLVEDGRAVSSHEPASRLVAVPKTYAGPRLIAAEPSANMFCQQNLLDYMVTRVRRSWMGEFVKFDDQTQNQKLCTLGSVDGAQTTIDLSMASDRLAPDLVGNLFYANRGEFLLALRATRTQFCEQTINSDCPARMVLKKFSTMGSAVTFPIQSIVFMTIAIASILTKRKKNASLRNIYELVGHVSVFGDDIIVPTDTREHVIASLESLRFKVNSNKSYWNGKFRESCGVDSFRGHDVTPVYYRQSYDGKTPETLASCVQTSNRFYKKFLLNAASLLASTLPKRIAQVAMGSGAFGLCSRTDLDNRHLKTRYNKNLQREELQSLSIKTWTKKTETESDSALYQYFTDRPSSAALWKNGYVRRACAKMHMSWSEPR